MFDITKFMPEKFRLREGAGGGDVKNGLCFMETVAFIAGEEITDEPECACTTLIDVGIGLNDYFNDEDRQELLPLAWSVAGSRSLEHQKSRRRVLGLAAVDQAKLVFNIYQEDYGYEGCDVLLKAIDLGDKYFRDQTEENKKSYQAILTRVCGSAAKAKAWGNYNAASAAKAVFSIPSAYLAANGNRELQTKIKDISLRAFREAILAGPNGGIPTDIVSARIKEAYDTFPVMEEV